MNKVELLRFAVDTLRREVSALDESEMEVITNCEPWTVRRLASHALNNQLLWGSVVTGIPTVSVEETMEAVPHEGDLELFAKDVAQRSVAMWQTEGVLEGVHSTAFGDLPGATVIDFPTIDALAHAWDLSASVGRPIEFPPELMPEISALAEATCTDLVREMGLIKAPTDPPADATDTERVMALAGRTIRR